MTLREILGNLLSGGAFAAGLMFIFMAGYRYEGAVLVVFASSYIVATIREIIIADKRRDARKSQ